LTKLTILKNKLEPNKYRYRS